MLQQVLHDKDQPLLKTLATKHKYKFATLHTYIKELSRSSYEKATHLAFTHLFWKLQNFFRLAFYMYNFEDDTAYIFSRHGKSTVPSINAWGNTKWHIVWIYFIV
jgi:hypothetical protein